MNLADTALCTLYTIFTYEIYAGILLLGEEFKPLSQYGVFQFIYGFPENRGTLST